MHRLAPTAALMGLLLAGSAIAAAPPPAATAPTPAAAGTSPSTPQLSPADQKRVEAIQQYQHDLVTVVALRAQPDYLLGAAILAKPFDAMTAGLDFDALSARAAAAPEAGPVTHWARIVACKSNEDCPNGEALVWLKKHATDNAAVWLIELDLAAANHDSKAEHAALRKAAAAQVYDDYHGKALAGVAEAVAVLPPLADTTAGAHDGQPDNPEGVRVLVTVNSMQALPRPDLGPVVKLCDKDTIGKHHEVKKTCLKLARTLQWGSSPIARGAGLHIEGQLVPGADATGEQARRDLAWQVHQYSALLQRSLTDPTQASRWLAAARNGGTELSLILATLRANGVPLNAPADAVSAPAPGGSASP